MVTMTKEAFHETIKKEIEINGKILESYKLRIKFLSSLKSEREQRRQKLTEEEEKELRDLEFEVDILERDIKGLRDLVGVELIEEIKARPDEEIDKNFREEEVANAIRGVNEAEKELKAKRKELKETIEKMNEIKKSGGGVANIREYEHLSDKRTQLESDIATTSKALQGKRNWLEKIPHLSVNEIRELLMNRIYLKPDYANLKNAVQKVSRRTFLPRYGRENAEELSSQIQKSLELRGQRKSLTITDEYKFNTLPYQARERVFKALGMEKHNENFDATTTISSSNMYLLEHVLKQIEEYIEEQLAILNNKFVLDEYHILPLIGIDFDDVTYKANLDVNNLNGQIAYFQRYADAFTTADNYIPAKTNCEHYIESLKALYKRRDEAKNGKLAFLNNGKIKDLNDQIRDLLYQMYLRVYSYFVNNIVNTEYFRGVGIQEQKLHFNNEKAANSSIAKLKEIIEKFENAVSNLLLQVRQQIHNYTVAEGKIVDEEVSVRDKIYRGGMAAAEILSDAHYGVNPDFNIDDEIKDGISLTRLKDIVDDIRSEAKEQVLVSDYELQLMSLDQLRALQQELNDKWNTGKTDDDTQYGDNGTGKGK